MEELANNIYRYINIYVGKYTDTGCGTMILIPLFDTTMWYNRLILSPNY